MKPNSKFLILFSGGSFDPSALAFINAAGITDNTQKKAINYLVVNLKSNGLWDKQNIIYPFVGGSASSNKYNLKDPRDLNAAFRLTFSGGVTHDNNGVTFGGVNGYANTFFVPSTNLTLNDESLHIYSRTDAASATVNDYDAGAATATLTQRSQLQIRTSGNQQIGWCNSNTLNVGYRSVVNTTGLGLFGFSRTAINSLKLYKNGVNTSGISSNNDGTALPNINMYLGCRNNNGAAIGYTARNQSYMSYGKGLNDADVLTLYNIVQQYQTILGRQV